MIQVTMISLTLPFCVLSATEIPSLRAALGDALMPHRCGCIAMIGTALLQPGAAMHQFRRRLCLRSTLDFDSPRFDIVKGTLMYRLWYGSNAEPDLYEQERRVTYSNQLTTNSSVTRTDFWPEPGGHDELRITASEH